MGKDAELAARSADKSGQDNGGGQVGQRPGGGEADLAGSAGGHLLALRVGVSEQAADGKQEDGAQADAEPCGDEKTRDFANDDGGSKNEEQAEAAGFGKVAARGRAEADAHQGEEQKKRVHAQLHAQPPA